MMVIIVTIIIIQKMKIMNILTMIWSFVVVDLVEKQLIVIWVASQIEKVLGDALPNLPVELSTNIKKSVKIRTADVSGMIGSKDAFHRKPV